LLLLDAIERIEISIRTQWAYYFAELSGPHAHLDPHLSKNNEWHVKNIAQSQKELARSDGLFIKHYQNTYTFPGEPCNKIARAYPLDYAVLVSFIEYLAYLRNLCANHSRVWNRKTTKTITLISLWHSKS